MFRAARPGTSRALQLSGSSASAGVHAPDGTTSDDTGPAGEAEWADTVTHLPENLSDQPLEVVLVELKTKRD